MKRFQGDNGLSIVMPGMFFIAFILTVAVHANPNRFMRLTRRPGRDDRFAYQ